MTVIDWALLIAAILGGIIAIATVIRLARANTRVARASADRKTGEGWMLGDHPTAHEVEDDELPNADIKTAEAKAAAYGHRLRPIIDGILNDAERVAELPPEELAAIRARWEQHKHDLPVFLPPASDTDRARLRKLGEQIQPPAGIYPLPTDVPAAVPAAEVDHHRITRYPLDGPVTHLCACGDIWPCPAIVTRVWEGQS